MAQFLAYNSVFGRKKIARQKAKTKGLLYFGQSSLFLFQQSKRMAKKKFSKKRTKSN